DVLNGDAGSDLLVSGAGNDVINGGANDDTIVWRAGNGRDVVDGGTGTDTFFAYGNATAEQFTIWTRAEWLNVAGNTAGQLNAGTAIIVTRNGNATANVIAELRNVEEIVIRGLGGGDTFNQVGDFTGTGLAYNTITIEGGDGDDTIDISSLQSEHRVVFRSTGGSDRLIGTLRPQDVIVLAAGAVIADYAEAANADGTVTLTGAGHSITFTGEPRIATADEVIGDYEAPVGAEAPVAQDDPDADMPDSEVAETEAAQTPEPEADAPEAAAPEVVFGTTGNDALIGGAGRDMIFGDAGNDNIIGGAGADMLFGDSGDDRIFGQGGDDYINAGAGNDVVFGGDGSDWIVAEVGDGDDVYYGDAGTDTLDMSAISANVTANLGTGFMGRGSVSSA
ncbi:MAG: calcium-binding protein, partial [Paracoccaceae bacterium]|nr:calcium-binding protein [Paracoccaceae bacterium]